MSYASRRRKAIKNWLHWCINNYLEERETLQDEPNFFGVAKDIRDARTINYWIKLPK